MKAITKVLAGGVAMAALASAAPAAAQYYPGYGYPGYGGGAGVIGQVIGQVLGNGYGGYSGYGSYGGGYGGYGANSQQVVNQCANAVQARLSGGAGYGSPYGYNGGYGGGYGAYGASGARVLGISRVEPRSSGGLTVRGVATSGRYASYGYANGQGQVDLTWKCKTDYRGLITDIDVGPAQSNYGYSNNYQPYDPYAAYGYRRY